MQISGGESKAKAHMLTFLKKSPDFKTAYLRNDKYCTTRGAFTFRSSTTVFQTYKTRLHTLFQNACVFPQSFHYRFCNIVDIDLEVNFHTMHKNYKT